MKKKESQEREMEIDKTLANFKASQEARISAMDKMKHDLAKFGEEADRKPEYDEEEDEQNFVCKICGKEFDDANKLGEHMSEHY